MTSTRSTDESASKKRSTGTRRRTVVLAAVIAAVGMLLAGLPVAGTAPTAQAQTVQHQTEWYINDQPRLYDRGNIVRLDSLRPNWNRNVYWGLLEHGGWENGNSYYTYASLGDTLGNRAEWQMGSRIGTQEIAVHIPGRCGVLSTARVTYEIHIGDQPVQTANVWQTAARDGDCYSDGLVILRNPSGGTGWVVNGAEVVIRVDDNDARPHHRVDYAGSRIGISAAAMRCIDNCTSRTAPPPTTTPGTSTTTPRISGLQSSMEIANADGYRHHSDKFQVSPASATATATVNERCSYLAARINGSGSSRTLTVDIGTRATPSRCTVTVKVTNGSTSVSRSVSVTVLGKKFAIKGRGFLGHDKGIIALRNFRTADGTQVRAGDEGGIVKDEKNLSHLGTSWIALGAKVWDAGVRVSGNALVKGDVHLRDNAEVSGDARVVGNRGRINVTGNAEVSGNARVFGTNVQVTGNAEVSGNAWVFSNGHRTQVFGYAKVSGNAIVHSNAKVSGNAKVFERANVFGNTAPAEVYGYAKVYGEAKVRNGAKVFGSAKICDMAEVSGGAQVSGRAQLSGSNRLTTSRSHLSGTDRQGPECPDRNPS